MQKYERTTNIFQSSVHSLQKKIKIFIWSYTIIISKNRIKVCVCDIKNFVYFINKVLDWHRFYPTFIFFCTSCIRYCLRTLTRSETCKGRNWGIESWNNLKNSFKKLRPFIVCFIETLHLWLSFRRPSSDPEKDILCATLHKTCLYNKTTCKTSLSDNSMLSSLIGKQFNVSVGPKQFESYFDNSVPFLTSREKKMIIFNV